MFLTVSGYRVKLVKVMNKNHINNLLQGYLNDSLTEKELRELLEIVRNRSNNAEIERIIDTAIESDAYPGLSDKARYDAYFSRIMKDAGEKKLLLLSESDLSDKNNKRRLTGWTRIAAAASILIMVTFGGLWIVKNYISDHGKTVASSELPVTDLGPGSNRALLTLGDGTTIMLDSAGNGLLADQAGTQVVKVEDGRLAYTSEGKRKAEVVYNTVTTPRAGQYELILPDGSKVWLNSESSIKFPVSFIGSFRVVEITGEAFFEVAENYDMPFRVKTAGITVEVLGTSFNLRAYADEGSVNTTLVEGSVQIASPVYQTTIAPGQMATADPTGQIQVENDVDIEEIIAWKEGLFIFNSETLEQIMSQVSRWYDVKIEYEGEITNKTFSGIVSRYSNVSQLLKIMEQAGIRFVITEETIKVELQ
ncbi:FecR family protein [bacterium]|nr:FecR family protein [bacterium]